MGAPPAPDPCLLFMPVPTLAPEPDPNTADDCEPPSFCLMRSALDAPPVHSHVARWHIHWQLAPSSSTCTARDRSADDPPPQLGQTIRCCPGV